MKFDEGFLARMREATSLLQTEGPLAATAAIQRALQDEDASAGDDATQASPPVIDLPGATPRPAPVPRGRSRFDGWTRKSAGEAAEDVDAVEVPRADRPHAGAGTFAWAACTNAAGTRRYKLYVPPGEHAAPLPLVVMLHGCTQDPDDFAAGTGMNRLADEYGCLVAYPAQEKNANGAQCWNWFEPGHQKRDRGEPSIIADIVSDIAKRHRVDADRVYVAGLSAGGAMAAVLAATYPDVFAAAGVHSGLPYGVAKDVASAFATMKRRKPKAGKHAAAATARAATPFARPVPVIVFHGDRDTTVHSGNGEQVLQQCVPAVRSEDVRGSEERGSVPGGRSYTRTVFAAADGRSVAERWVVHGAGHAWSGGSQDGSYTDPAGPSASREMLRFFLAQRRSR